MVYTGLIRPGTVAGAHAHDGYENNCDIYVDWQVHPKGCILTNKCNIAAQAQVLPQSQILVVNAECPQVQNEGAKVEHHAYQLIYLTLTLT